MSNAKKSTTRKPPDGLDKRGLLRLYERLMLLRRFETVAKELNAKGAWPGFLHLYIGEEASAVGVCDHLRNNDWVTSTHRGHGHCLAKGVSPKAIMAELYGKATGCSGGRGGSMHMFAPKVGLLGTNGLVAGGIPLAVGAGLSAKVRGTDQIGVAFFGDGASNHGAFLESINFAAVQKIPVVFVCENNLYATATALSKVTANVEIATKAAAFGCAGVAVDGTDVLAVWVAAREAVARARTGKGPTLIEVKTYRWCGHHEGDPPFGTYRTKEELESWKQRDCVSRFRRLLTEDFCVATGEELDAIDRRQDEIVAEAVRFGETSPEPDPATTWDHVYAEPINPPLPPEESPVQTLQQGWMEAVRDGIAEEMRRNKATVYLGEGVGERGGCFGHTKGLWQEFGSRVIDTPICELAFTGASVGASATGCRAIADLMFVDFLYEAGSQIAQQAAKLRYLSNGQVSVPMVVRAPIGMVKSAAAHHSGSYYPAWGHIPGLLVAVPSNPADAKGLIKTALRAGDPVLFLEHKALFSSKGPVPIGEHFLPMGVAAVVQPGTDLTLVTCGLLVRVCMEAAAELQQQGISCEVIDLRTIVPLDVETVAASLHKTGRLLVVDEAWSMFGVGAELSAAMMELAFDDLDAPIARLHTERVSFPFSPVLDEVAAVSAPKIIAAARELMAGRVTPMKHPKAARRATPAAFPAAPQASSLKPQAPAASDPKPQVFPDEGVAILMPNMDLTIEEAKIVHWIKKVGDSVRAGEGVVEVETDKATLEIESPASGVLVKTLAAEGEVVRLAQPVGILKPE